MAARVLAYAAYIVASTIPLGSVFVSLFSAVALTASTREGLNNELRLDSRC
jgi:hypothetical protein